MIPGDIADDNNEDEINDIQKKFINTKGKCKTHFRPNDIYLELKLKKRVGKCKGAARLPPTKRPETLMAQSDNDKPPRSYNTVHGDIWYNVADHIKPEYVQTFALICRQTAELVNTQRFWKQIYRSYCQKSSADTNSILTLPEQLQSHNVLNCKLAIMRARVVESLFLTYSPLSKRIAKGYSLTKLIGCSYVSSWHEQEECVWISCYKFCNRRQNIAEIKEGRDFNEIISNDCEIDDWEDLAEGNNLDSKPKYIPAQNHINEGEADIPIDIHTLKLQDWLVSRRIVPKTIQKNIKDIRTKISNALQDMPANDQLIKLLSGTNINYYHCKEIVEILKQTEKDTKSVFGTYGSQRMKDWQEILRLYEKDNVYLAESAQIYVRNVNYEVPGVRKQMTKLEQQSDECLKRVQDLGKPESQLLAEHASLLQQLGVKGENLREEFLQVLSKLPDMYANSIRDVSKLEEAINLFSEGSNKQNLHILRHLIEFGNTTVYQYVHKEEPLTVEEPPIKLNLNGDTLASSTDETEIDFGGDDNGGTSSTISAEIIDFGELNLDGNNSAIDSDGNGGDIDWGVESGPNEAVEINFDIPIEEYGIVIEGTGMDGGIAKGEQAYTILDSPTYRDRFLDEIYELDAFLRMRLFELNQLDASSNIMFSLMDSIFTYDAESIRKMLRNIELILGEVCNEQTRHLFQLKHSPKYADLLATKLRQMTKAVSKIRDTKEVLKIRSLELKRQRVDLNPVLAELISQTKKLQLHIENDISKRYKNRVVNLMGGVN